MDLTEYGYSKELEELRTKLNLGQFDVGRVIAEHKERYIVRSEDNELEAEVVGNLRYTASSRADFPAVGDWVAISAYDDSKAIIHAVFPRKSTIERKSPGKSTGTQIIASNIDYAFIIQSVDRDFNLNRIERYLSICQNSNVKPIIILNKIDLIEKTELSELENAVKNRIPDITVIAISNETLEGYDHLSASFEKGKSYCLLGSSGVGKSSLVNRLCGKDIMKTNSISSSTMKGKHVTSHRELILLENGSIIIDNPGMREVGITNDSTGLEISFDMITKLAENCHYKDCSHVHEEGCAVMAAVENGSLDKDSYDNYLKLLKEREFFESSLLEKKHKDKSLGKLIKQYKKDTKDN